MPRIEVVTEQVRAASGRLGTLARALRALRAGAGMAHQDAGGAGSRSAAS
jgi:hypothetical protein